MIALISRVGSLAALFAVEVLIASVAFDGQSIRNNTGLVTYAVSLWGAIALRLAVCFVAILGTFTLLDRKPQVAAFSASVGSIPLRIWPGILHLFAISAFAWLGNQLYLSGSNPTSADHLTLAMLTCAPLALITGGLAVLPAKVWRDLAVIPGIIWLYAAGGASLLIATTPVVRALWVPAAHATFILVRALLSPFVPVSVADPGTLELGTSRFSVIIAPQCSGLEGISLLLLFGSVWLVLFRKECRFPQALLLLPLGAIILYLLNAARVAVLILIGHAGAPAVALGGFHSQAGWLAFNAVALGLCIVARHLPWFTTARSAPVVRNTAESPAVLYYLLPLLSILAAGMVSHALSGTFEWLYGLRLLAPCLVFFFFRSHYRAMTWTVSRYAPLAGLVVLIIWLGLDYVLQTSPPAAMPPELRNTSPLLRVLWLSLRTLSAIVTVPVAEELAFRGFLIRRLQAREFDALPPTRFSWPSLLISSTFFGALHGTRWPAGILAGLIFGATYLRRGSLADAILAHAITNAILAASVLLLGTWQYW